jgi:SAM-dependent methyltransferase
MNEKMHWDAVYGSKSPESVSWYAPHLQMSLQYVKSAARGGDPSIIDVGGGESTLVDDLLEAGFTRLTVLDISAKAIEVTKDRLGRLATRVNWMVADVLDAQLPSDAYDIWHDRAVFHFLVTDAQREHYVAQVLRALKPGGYAIVGAFGPEGPEKCSGLPVSRYDASELHDTFGAPFQLVDSSVEVHTTPWGTPQQFVYCFCRRQTT